MYNYKGINKGGNDYKWNPNGNSKSVWEYDTDCSTLINERVSKSSSFKYSNVDSKTPEPNFMLTTECDIGITNPFSGSEETITKTDLAHIMVIIDMVVVIMFMMFIWFMEISQENYATQFET